MTDIHYLSLIDVADRIRRRELSSVEVTQALLDRIARHDAALKSVALLLADTALEQARRADAELAAGMWRGPLHGVPVGIKDLLWTKGVPTAAGLDFLRDFRPAEDATVVARLKRAGAVVIAKLNMTEGAMFGYHESFPKPVNPWSAAHWPGASSSGSGVAVAAGFCFAALGTDTGGSIRYPSTANGLTGIKPTWGRVSRHGLIHLCESTDHIGPIARSAADAAAVLQAIAGADARDPTALADPVPDYIAGTGGGIGDLSIGIDWHYATEAIPPEIAENFRAAVATLEDLGARIREVRVPWIDADVVATLAVFSAELAASHADHYPAHAHRYSPDLRQVIEASRGMDAVSVARGYQARDRLTQALKAVFRDVDLILTPGFGEHLPTVETFEARCHDMDWLRHNLGRFTWLFNLTGVPTISLPGGLDRQGLPMGIQLVGPALGEPALVRAGAAFQAVTDFHTRRPPLG